MAANKMADGLMISEDNKDNFCEGCIFGMQHCLPFPTGRSSAKEIGQLVHSNVCGPISVPAFGGSVYFGGSEFRKDRGGNWEPGSHSSQ
jgi:hypothetical protein